LTNIKQYHFKSSSFVILTKSYVNYQIVKTAYQNKEIINKDYNCIIVATKYKLARIMPV